MSIPATGADFLELVVQSGLLTRDQTEPYAGSELAYEPDAPRLLAEQMVADGLLTTFQTRQLLAGKIRGYFFADNKYKALVPLGTGTLGPVILCEDVRLHQQVAIQLLQKCPDKDSGKLGGLERFVREALAVGTMNHPNLVRVFGMEWSGKTPFLILDHADGTNLRQLVTESGPPTIQQAAQWVRQAATGLQQAHAKRLIHREVSPSNLILDANGNVRVTGFGLTHLFRAPSPGGTDPNDPLLAALADFMAPEQAYGAPGDARSDVYSLGATLYFLLTGRLPFESDSVSEKVTGHQSRQPAPVRDLRPDVTYGLVEVIGHMMAKNPNERYQTVGDVAVAMAQWARDPATKAAKAVAPPPPPAPAPKREPTFPPLGTVSSGSGVSWGTLPTPAITGPGTSRGAIPKPAPAPKPAPVPAPQFDSTFESNGDTRHESRLAAIRAPARQAPAAPPEAEAPPEGPEPDTDEQPIQGPTTARAALGPALSVRVPNPKPASPASTKVRKGISPAAFGVAILIVALVVGGVVAVVVIATGGGTPTVATPKPLPEPSGSNGGPKSGTGPDTTPKQPEPKPKEAPVKPPDTPVKPPDTPVKPPDTPVKPPDTPVKPPESPPVAGVAIEIKGSGSTFIKPAMEYWTDLYKKKTGIKIEYVGNGSGSGVANMIDKVTDFGCTDAFMSDAQLKKAKDAAGEVIHIPLAMGAVVVAYNLDVKQQLRFTSEVLVDIYLGKITKWDDPAIVACNPGVALPNDKIIVMHRSDSSGTTAIWTEYLNKVNPEWEKKAGEPGNTAKWPIGEGVEKSDGLAKAVGRTPGSIGYVELAIALERNLKYAQVRNKSEKYVSPTAESVTAAANGSLQAIKDDFRYSLTYASGDASYPIVGTTWLVLYADQTVANKKGKELVKFLQWAVTEGQPKLKDLQYAPLPEKLAERVKNKIATIQLSE